MLSTAAVLHTWESVFLLEMLAGTHNGWVDDVMGRVPTHSAQQVWHTLPHVGLGMIETREQLRNDTWESTGENGDLHIIVGVVY